MSSTRSKDLLNSRKLIDVNPQMIESTGFMPRTPFLEGVILMKGGRLPVLVSPSVRGEDEVVQNADDPVQGEAEEEQGDRENDEGPGHVSHI